MTWGDSVGNCEGIKPKYVPPCGVCGVIGEMHDIEICKKCVSIGREPNTEEYLKHIFIAPRCEKCYHNDPDYIVISNDENGIKMACKWCKAESYKD